MKKAFRKVYNLYLNQPIMIEAYPHELPPYAEDGLPAIKCFFNLENGVVLPTNNISEVKRALDGKKSLNLQIKMWAETVGRELSTIELREMIEELNMPQWVFNATMNQAVKLIKEDHSGVSIELLVD